MKSDGDKQGLVSAVVAEALSGTWINTLANPTTFTKVTITPGDLGLLTIDMVGASTPPDDLGPVVAVGYCQSVSANHAIAFTAIYDLSFKQMIVTAHLEASQLEIESFSRFIDGSGRSSYYTIDTFRRG